MWVPLVIIHFHAIFHEINQRAWGTPMTSWKPLGDEPRQDRTIVSDIPGSTTDSVDAYLEAYNGTPGGFWMIPWEEDDNMDSFPFLI